METNNLDFIKQALLYTKQNNLVYKKVYASGPPTPPYLAIKVISKDPNTILPTEEQDEHYFVRTFLTDGTQNWPAWRLALGSKGWWILSATETKQKGTKTTANIPLATEYKVKTEFLDTQVSKDRPKTGPFGFPGFRTPNYKAVAGLGSTFYKGVTESGGTLNRNYAASNASTNMIQNYFLTLEDDQKIIIGWSGGPFNDWWEDKYTMSAAKETGEMENFAVEDNPEAVATFNQIVPLKVDYTNPNFFKFYKDKKEEFIRNPDPEKGNFTLPLPTEDDVIFYDLDLKTFYELGLEPALTSKEVDTGTVNGLINKLMGQIKNDQPIDEINRNREQALKDQLDRGNKAQNAFGTGANIFTNLFRKVDK